MHRADDKMAMPNGMHSTPFSEESSASMQSPQPEDRVWQTGQWVSPATDPASFPMSASEVQEELVTQDTTECPCRIRRQTHNRRGGRPGLTVTLSAQPLLKQRRATGGDSLPSDLQVLRSGNFIGGSPGNTPRPR